MTSITVNLKLVTAALVRAGLYTPPWPLKPEHFPSWVIRS